MIAAVILMAGVVGADPPPAAVRPYETQADLTPRCRVDDLVFTRLKQLQIAPAYLCSDEVFLRRVYLDVIGTLPTPAEARQFLYSPSLNRRTALIDRLLQRDEFADYWAMKWGDLLRIKAEFPINLWPNAAQAYHRWVRSSLRANLPYDRFVRELLTASGSNFRVPQVNFYRAMQSREPQAMSQTVALTLMGTRAEKWPKERLEGMAAFFRQVSYKETAEWKEEIVFFDPGKPVPHASGAAVYPDGTPATLAPGRDPRVVFADWLIRPDNPWFARNAVNRVWSWLLGRGIVSEPDDIRPDNPPSNPDLLAYLEHELVASNYDVKHVFRLILNSKTYQLSAIPRSRRPEAAAQFASYPVRRLEAEVLIDALNQVTGTSETYTSAIPEPFTFIPEGQRSIALADGSINSPFLELFGRPSRDTGLESERNNRPVAAQRLHMLNSSHIRKKLEQGPYLRSLVQSSNRPRDVVEDLYLTILSRHPTDDELRIVTEYNRSGTLKKGEVVTDLAWALINGAEFQYRH
jgi:hypothetical protein